MAEESVCDEQVYHDIYTAEVEKLRNHLYYKSGDLVIAEDLAQDSFIKLWKKCAEVVYETVLGFVYTVANRLLIDHFRAEKVALKFDKPKPSEIDHEDPYFVMRTEEFREKIEGVISDLPEGQREAFLMNRIDKLTYKEIAERLDISTTAVEKRMSKALLKLKSSIEEFKNFEG